MMKTSYLDLSLEEIHNLLKTKKIKVKDLLDECFERIEETKDLNAYITLDKENNLLTIECEGSCYKLSTLRAEDFPEIPQVTVENSIEIPQKDLRNIIKQTIFAVGTDEKRKLYTGSLFDVDNTTLNVVSIDGYRLAIRKTEVVSNSSFKMVIPRKNIK